MMHKKTLIAAVVALLLSPLTQAAEFGGAVEPETEALRTQAAQIPQTPETVKTMTASKMAKEFLKKAGVVQGYNDDKGMIVEVGVANFSVKGNESQLMRIRSNKYTEAMLNAKAEIIKSIRTSLTVNQMVQSPESGLGTEFDRQLEALSSDLEKKKAALAEAIATYDKAKAEEFAGVNVADFIRDGIAAVCKRFNIELDISKLQSEQAQRVQKALQDIEAGQAQIAAIEKKREELKNSIDIEQVSVVEELSQMPLCGAITAAQFESQVDGMYSIAVVLLWSAKQETLFRSIAEGKPVQITRKGSQSLADFINSNDWSGAIGGRKFLDNQGNVHFLGIGAWPVEGNSGSAIRIAKQQARAQAIAEIGLSFRGDMLAHTVTKNRQVEKKDGSIDTAASLASVIQQNLKNFQLQGASMRYDDDELIHPITGKRLAVVILDLTSTTTQLAKIAERSNYRAAETLEKTNQQSQGYKAGLDAHLQSTQQDRTSFNAGRQEGFSATQPQTQIEPQAPAAGTTSQPRRQVNPDANSSYQGAGSSTDVFQF